MVVLHIIDNLKVGGAQEIILNLVRYRSPDVEHHVAVLYGPADFDQEIIVAGGQVSLLAARRRQVGVALLAFIKLTRQVRPDVINLHLEYATVLGLFMRPLAVCRRCVVTLHALKTQLPGWFYPVLRLLRRRADLFVVEDEVACGEVAAMDVGDERIVHVPIGTDYLERIAKMAPPKGVRDEFGIPPGAPLLLNVARMHPAKGQDHLLRAFSRVLAECSDAWLVIVGYGSEESKLKSLAAALGIAEHVVFPGLRRDLENFYTDADLFVMSAFDEGMGVVIFQAMAFGLPIVAYDAGSISEVVADGETGTLVPVGDLKSLAAACMGFLTANPELVGRFGQLAKRRVKNDFSSAMMTRRYEESYRTLLKGRR